MKLFKRKKDGFVDLGEYHQKQDEKIADLKREFMGEKSEESSSPAPFFGMFGGADPSSTASTETPSYPESDNSDEKRRRLAKRLADMTEKLEDLSNQIYHLQQRIEVLEKKGGVNSF